MSLVIHAPKPMTRLTINSERSVRIIFFGTPSFALPALRALYSNGWPVAAVITAPDKPVGRKMIMTASPAKTVAQELDLPVYSPASLKDDLFFTVFSELRPDLCIVVAYGSLIPQRYLDIPRLGFLNIHPSLLPAYRGPSPIQTAILDGCTNTGVSIMLLDAEMDHGPVLAQTSWTIPSAADYPFCEDELSNIGAQLLLDTVPGYAKGTIVPQAQDDSLATITRKFTRPDGRLDWTLGASLVHNRIRALATNPATWTTWQGKNLNIVHAYKPAVPVPAYAPGTVFKHEDHLMVACGQDAIALETIQLEGSTRQNARDFLNGHPAILSAVLG